MKSFLWGSAIGAVFITILFDLTGVWHLDTHNGMLYHVYTLVVISTAIIYSKLEDIKDALDKRPAPNRSYEQGWYTTPKKVVALKGHWHSGYEDGLGRPQPPYDAEYCNFNKKPKWTGRGFEEQPYFVARECPFRDSRSER